MKSNYIPPRYKVKIDRDLCIQCGICAKQCGFEAISFKDGVVKADSRKCAKCLRCASYCPAGAISIEERNERIGTGDYWSSQVISNVIRQSATGGILLGAMGSEVKQPPYFDRILLNASQVTNPSIDPLREPMEIRTYLGGKPESVQVAETENGFRLNSEVPAQVRLDVPIVFAAMSYGSISHNAHLALAMAAEELGTLYNTGEGGLHRELRRFGQNTIVQVASGRYGLDIDYLNTGRVIEIKVGQGAKPGIGGHLPGKKVNAEVAATRMIPEGSDAISPAPHHDVYSIEDLSQLIHALKEATQYQKPVAVKIAAVHNVAAIASGIARAGADIISIDGFRGGTGAAPVVTRDNVGIPIELALAVVDQRLRDERIRHRVSLLVGGGIRSSADVIKAIALGADAVYIGTAALIALGCRCCRSCTTGKCSWGIATQDPEKVKRLDPYEGKTRVVNLVKAWAHEIKDIMGGMGLNTIESLRGNRLHLRGIGMTQKELDLLGIKHAGEGA
ncbi:MAG: alpha-hydroxy-acid oxidizing protein [Firmicutes bacterium]|nr:alpha-hydroxy-acid oxidizing protein [Bacillota bacterium]